MLFCESQMLVHPFIRSFCNSLGRGVQSQVFERLEYLRLFSGSLVIFYSYGQGWGAARTRENKFCMLSGPWTAAEVSKSFHSYWPATRQWPCIWASGAPGAVSPMGRSVGRGLRKEALQEWRPCQSLLASGMESTVFRGGGMQEIGSHYFPQRLRWVGYEGRKRETSAVPPMLQSLLTVVDWERRVILVYYLDKRGPDQPWLGHLVEGCWKSLRHWFQERRDVSGGSGRCNLHRTGIAQRAKTWKIDLSLPFMLSWDLFSTRKEILSEENPMLEPCSTFTEFESLFSECNFSCKVNVQVLKLALVGGWIDKCCLGKGGYCQFPPQIPPR